MQLRTGVAFEEVADNLEEKKMANISDFKAKLVGGGARANQFKVTMPFYSYAQVGGEIEDMAFLCQGTQLPEMVIGELMSHLERQIKLVGERTFR